MKMLVRLPARLSPEFVATSHVAPLRENDPRAAAALTLRPWGALRSSGAATPNRDDGAPTGDDGALTGELDGGAAPGGARRSASERRARPSRAGSPSPNPGGAARGQLGASLLGCAEVPCTAC